MMHPLSMFMEKGDPHDTPRMSMTRVVAFLFALTTCWAVLLYAKGGHDLNWPFVALGIVTVLAVPLQALCKFLQQWFATSPGQALLGRCVDKVMGTLDEHHEHGEAS